MNLEHFFRMTNYIGIFQHSKYSVPDFANGYTTDDNARALIVSCWLYTKTRDDKYLNLIYTYSSFMLFALNNDGTFKNFMNFSNKFIDSTGSEDCFGRSIWALGFMNFCKIALPSGLNSLNSKMIKICLNNIENLKFIRSKAYALIGLTYMKENFSSEVEPLIKQLADEIILNFKENKTENWYWFENIITYGSGIIPYALLRSYEISKNEEHLQIALEILDFLDTIVFRNGYLKLIGCNGWYPKGGEIAKYDEQPIDALDMCLAYSKAYRLTNNIKYLNKAKLSYKWFDCNNALKSNMIDPDNGGCYDGITSKGVNKNQGAESQFAYIMSTLVINSL